VSEGIYLNDQGEVNDILGGLRYGLGQPEEQEIAVPQYDGEVPFEG
jgi:hypothetical protein